MDLNIKLTANKFQKTNIHYVRGKFLAALLPTCEIANKTVF